MKNIEKSIIDRGYVLVDETKPFRTYERGHKRIIYHISSKKVWGKFYINDVGGRTKASTSELRGR